MNGRELLKRIRNWDALPEFADRVEKGKLCRVEGVSGTAARFFASGAADVGGRKFVYCAPNELAAKRAFEDIKCFLGEGVLLLEPAEYMFFNIVARNRERDYGRVETLRRLYEGNYSCLVLSTAALMQFTIAPDRFENCDFTLKEGEEYDIGKLSDRLAAMGYVRVPTVEGTRQFSVRGDIFDVFPISAEMPYRVEFYGDTVDLIKVFDPSTQRSVSRATEFTLQPESELKLARIDVANVEKRVLKSFERTRNRITNPATAARYKAEAETAVSLIKSGADFPGMDRFAPFIVGREHDIRDYVKGALWFAESPAEIESAANVIREEHLRILASISAQHFTPDELADFYMSPKEVADLLGSVKAVSLGAGGKGELFEVRSDPVVGAAGSETVIKEYLGGWFEKGLDVFIAAEKKDKFRRITEELKKIGGETTPEFEQVQMPALSGGFGFIDAGFALVSESSFFNVGTRQSGGGKKVRPVSTDDFFNDIHPGDYVVHDIHGIGIFSGIESRQFEGVTKDFVVINYAEGGKLYLPSLQLGTVHKYVGKEDSLPRISTLGGRDWQNEKDKVKRSLREYVEELAELYAKRSKIEGFAFPKDDEWQIDFERRFEFEPTSEQIICANEIKNDMEMPKPMDRLLCGDVGFGKTEVAFRAAFKAVAAGKQVAMLVPTTILCQQHFFTAAQRFKDFPVTIDYICRFRTAKEISDIKKGLKEGKIDIVIGTHGLVRGQGVEFKDLGLVIIDEEQRFGVMQKEKLKMQHPAADTLLLSATPIPRTLNMSLSKIRDISVITEPPVNRNPVQTYVLKLNEEVVKNAIFREIARGGQVFYLFNRVRFIEERLASLKKLVPEARICVAHGQMAERELERVMRDFIDRKYDVMLCSTIIESGLDIANVNTIIVEHGERLGLAQMYQIRGRVGRSDTRAYAYITYPDEETLTEDAWQRLRAISEFTEFGSGIKVAMRDLEIRGAGAIFGEKQSGEVSSVGYDLYNRMLSDVITEVTGGTPSKERVTVTVDFTVSSYIPGEYIRDPDTRMEIYRKIAEIGSEEDLSDMTDELLDRFPGEIPQNIINLMHLSYMKSLAAACGLKSVIQEGQTVELEVDNDHLFDSKIKDNFAALNASYRGRFNIMATEKRLYAQYKISDKVSLYNHAKVIEDVERFLKTLSKEK